MLQNLMEYGFLLEVLQPETSVILNLSLLDIISFKSLNEFQSMFCIPCNFWAGCKKVLSSEYWAAMGKTNLTGH